MKRGYPDKIIENEMEKVNFGESRSKASSYLVRPALYPLEWLFGSMKCSKKWCKVCENAENSDTSRSSVTSETLKINHQLTCDDKMSSLFIYI